jgi:hypothetical protein
MEPKILILLRRLEPEDESITTLRKVGICVYQATCHNITDDFNLQQHCCEELKYCTIAMDFNAGMLRKLM